MTINEFIADWQSDADTIELYTSGSTGDPQLFRASKEKMVTSATLTCNYLGLKEGDSALLCLPLDYIAGKMMVVRSLVAGLKLIDVEPKGNPLAGLDANIDFAAMVPLQVYNSLQVAQEREKLKSIRHLIIGGGPIDDTLSSELRSFPNHIWSTYGMTETLSHIALRRLNGPQADEWYSPLPGVKISQDEEKRLIIDAPMLCSEILKTNDIAEFSDDDLKFKIIGRCDNVIISGGVKLNIEKIEKTLLPYMKSPFAVTKKKDIKFGEIVVLLVDKSVGYGISEIENICNSMLNEYERPRLIGIIDKIPMTATYKINRAEAMKIADNNHYICKYLF